MPGNQDFKDLFKILSGERNSRIEPGQFMDLWIGNQSNNDGHSGGILFERFRWRQTGTDLTKKDPFRMTEKTVDESCRPIPLTSDLKSF